jgi:5-methylthioribose kinase
MSKFNKYFLMNEVDVIEYVKEKYDFFAKDAILKCKEIGDGNLNYVFRISDENDKSVILKHSGVETRSKSGRLVDTDRNRIEAEILIHQAKFVPVYVPEVYGYDKVMCCCAMEDLREYEIMRKALLEYKVFPRFADQITTYMVDILLTTTDIAMNHKEKKQMVKRYINPDLCDISEQLVYSEALLNVSKKNYVIPSMEDFVKNEIYDDTALCLEGAKLKFDFMNHAQALIHGDLHSGSIFVTEAQTKVFDPEFAFYGPIGYDLGNVIAHLLFAMFHGQATLENGNKKDIFINWTMCAIKEIVDLFIDKFNDKFEEIVTENLAKVDGFKAYYIHNVLKDTAGTTGMEVIRRIVGVAKVADITSITNEEARQDVEKKMIYIAKALIMNRETITSGQDYINIINQFNSSASLEGGKC